MTSPVDDAGEINYDLVLHLDAEDLAEGGILEAYNAIAHTSRGMASRQVR
jgi:hypothetical protein